jgi:hypothetical protein
MDLKAAKDGVSWVLLNSLTDSKEHCPLHAMISVLLHRPHHKTVHFRLDEPEHPIG